MHKFNPFHLDENAVPPQEVRFQELKVEPWEDNLRIRVHLRITPFIKPPNLSVSLSDSGGTEVASASIIENIDFDLVFTLHIRPPDAPGPFQLIAAIEYEDIGMVDQKTIRFKLPDS